MARMSNAVFIIGPTADGTTCWLDVEGVPDRETSPVATLAREPVPDREGDRQEPSGRERGARGWAKGPLEDGRPFSLVVIRDTREIARVVGGDVRASLAGELQGSGTGQIEEPEIHRVLTIAEDEIGLAGARWHLRRNLDRHRVGELGWRGSRRRACCFGKRVCGLLGLLRRPARRSVPPPLLPAVLEVTARSSPSYPRSCRAIERGGRSTLRRKSPER